MTCRNPLSNACILTLLLTGLLPAGCGEKPPLLVEVSGKVQVDGKPVTAATIYLHPAASNAPLDDVPSSLLQLDGSFQARTFPWGPGVPPGEYAVTLDPRSAERLQKPDYAQAEKTPWKLTVPESGLQNQTLTVE